MQFRTVKDIRDILDDCEKWWSSDDTDIYGKFEDLPILVQSSSGELFDGEIAVDYKSHLSITIRKSNETTES